MTTQSANFNQENREQGTIKRPPSVKKKTKKSSGLFLGILILILIILVIFFLEQNNKINIFGDEKNEAEVALMDFNADNWKAIFLTNGQVYFGKIKNPNADYVELYDIYYLQVQNIPIQPAQPASDEAGVQDAVQYQQQTTLVKFGTEIHKPKDKMFVNRDHVLFYEDLNPDSQVVLSIEDYLQNLASESQQ